MSSPCPTFTDSAGRVWPIVITLDTFDRAEKENVPLPFTIGPAFTTFMADPKRVASALWLACEPDKSPVGYTPELFAKRLDAKAFRTASVALTEAMIEWSFGTDEAAAVKKRFHDNLAERQRRIVAGLPLDDQPPEPATTHPAEPAPTPTHEVTEPAPTGIADAHPVI